MYLFDVCMNHCVNRGAMRLNKSRVRESLGMALSNLVGMFHEMIFNEPCRCVYPTLQLSKKSFLLHNQPFSLQLNSKLNLMIHRDNFCQSILQHADQQ